MTDLISLSPIYASLTRAIAVDLARIHKISIEAAEVMALEITLRQAQELAVGMEEMDLKFPVDKNKNKE